MRLIIILSMVVWCSSFSRATFSALASPTSRARTRGPRVYIPPLSFAPSDSVEALVGDFHLKMSMLLGRQSESTVPIHPRVSSQDVHLEVLREQLEHTRSQPILFLGRTSDLHGRVYACPMEKTSSMIDIFGSSMPRRLNWAVLEVRTGGQVRVELLAYAQTKGAGMHHVRWALGRSMGGWATTMAEVLRRSPATSLIT